MLRNLVLAHALPHGGGSLVRSVINLGPLGTATAPLGHGFQYTCRPCLGARVQSRLPANSAAAAWLSNSEIDPTQRYSTQRSPGRQSTSCCCRQSFAAGPTRLGPPTTAALARLVQASAHPSLLRSVGFLFASASPPSPASTSLSCTRFQLDLDISVARCCESLHCSCHRRLSADPVLRTILPPKTSEATTGQGEADGCWTTSAPTVSLHFSVCLDNRLAASQSTERRSRGSYLRGRDIAIRTCPPTARSSPHLHRS